MNTPGMCTRIGAILVGLLACWSIAEAKVVYVAETGNDTNDGLSWTTAKVTVQAGLNVAVAGDEVWVAAGTYAERIRLTAGVALYGGFTGSETELVQRNWKASPTILDGNQAGSVVTAPSGATATTRIDGFTIRNGTGTLSDLDGYGGGIYCSSSSSPTISNNTITGNSAGFSGGGISCSFSSPTITNNTITGNSAGFSGGGISCSSSSPTITNNTIMGNRVTEANIIGGGGVYCYGGSPTIANNTITGNSAGYSGGGICCEFSSPTIANTIVAFNTSGVFRRDSGTPSLRYNCVYGNAAYNYCGVTDPTGTNGNISVDPQLLAADYGETHLKAGSPCVDTGDDAVVQPGSADMDGEPRIQSTQVDIGADEFNGTQPSFTPRVVRVSPSGNDNNDGSSWELAKRTVQAGINATASPSGGDVWVATGTYTERITLTLFFHVYGGFAGTETRRDQRNWVSHKTILDGSVGGSVVSVSFGSVMSVVDGFTIRNGEASYGGGIYCSSSSSTIANNTITANRATGSAARGGGVYCSSSSPTIVNNTITGNRATGSLPYGGGVFCSGGSPMIWNNTIIGNTAFDGGGIRCSGGSPTISNNTIIGNNASSGGGIHCSSSSQIITNNIIRGNAASRLGGGLYLCESSPTITGNAISENTASDGGGIFCCYSSATVKNNAITGNYGDRGGGIGSNKSSLLIANNTITGNAAQSGGGIYCYNSYPTITNTTITGNSASSHGGGIYCYNSSSPTITNTTITANSASNGGGIYWSSSAPSVTNTIIAFNSSGIYKYSGSVTPILRYNCVYGNTADNYAGLTDPTGTDGNLSADPLFVRTPSAGTDGQWATADDDPGDLHLKAGSPCIDAGDNGAVPAGILTDLDGLLRFVDDPATPDTGLGTAPIVDMGVYEYVPGDYDRDGDIDADDMKAFAACISGPTIPYSGDCAGADFDADNDVDQSDFGFIQRCFSGAGKAVDPACGG